MAEDFPGCFSAFKIFKKSGRSTGSQQPPSSPASKESAAPTDQPWLAEKPPAYSENRKSEIFRPEVLVTIEKTVAAISDELRSLSLWINDNPELGFKEFRTHDRLVNFMESHGFNVTPHYLLNTAFRAEFTYGKGGRVIGVNSEMDALPGIGHACGHNLIAICGIGVAIAIKAAMESHRINGKVVLLGTPAEEGGGGKQLLIDKGGYDDMNACVMSHPGTGEPNSTGLGTSLAIMKLDVEYHGHTAHAAAAPWEGQNALDAAFLAYGAVSVLRQQIKPDHRVHGVIHGKDWAPNIIPDYALMNWIVRAPTGDEVSVLKERVRACIEAGAQATACKVDVDDSAVPYLDLIQNTILGQNYGDVVSEKYNMVVTGVSGSIGGSTDFGNVTYKIPGIHPMFAIPSEENGGNHTALFAKAARTTEAHQQTLKVINGLAHTGMRVLADDGFYAKVKEEFLKATALRSK